MDRGQAALAPPEPGRSPAPNVTGYMHNGATRPQPPPHVRHSLPPPPQWSYYAAAQHSVPREYVSRPQPPPLSPPFHGLSPNNPTAVHVPHSSSMSPSRTPLPLPVRPHGSLGDPAFVQVPSVSAPRPGSPSSRQVSPCRRNFTPPLPWYSVAPSDFPPRVRRGRRRKPPLVTTSLSLELPPQASSKAELATSHGPSPSESSSPVLTQTPPINETTGQHQEGLARSTTPATSQSPSEAGSTQPTTPSSLPRPRSNQRTAGARQTGKIIPAVPIVTPQQKIPTRQTSSRDKAQTFQDPTYASSTSLSVDASSVTSNNAATPVSSGAATTTQNVVPKSWADLVKSKTPHTVVVNGGNGPISEQRPAGAQGQRPGSLQEALRRISGDAIRMATEIVTLKPRGLVNTGNMCYMNSVLLFCAPFYEFLNNINSFTTQSFSNATPMIDNMVHFFREFAISQPSSQAPSSHLGRQANAPKQYGEPFTPDFLYDVIRTLPRFSSMRRGHQQDAEEFLGFLLEELHQECVKTMKNADAESGPQNVAIPRTQTTSSDDQGWLEVGPRQKPTVTRSSGFMTDESPITKIFGGKLRSELRVPGAKSSVTSEPYQSLQLDIGSPQVDNITDALKGLARSELLQGEFPSPRGSGAATTKQVFVEAVPPVLILHLKRFQYDNTGGTQKIWKMVGYPLELDIPKEMFPTYRRAQLAMAPLRYRLVGVIYHHGKNASGGHYTADVRYKDNDTWIRLDDTMITDVRKEDVAVCGSDQHQEQSETASAHYDARSGADGTEPHRWPGKGQPVNDGLTSKGWSQVHRTAPSTTNGSTPGNVTSRRSSPGRTPLKDDRVAYLLFYQRMAPYAQAAA